MLSKKTKVLFIPAWYPSRKDKLAGVFTERHAQVIKDLVTVYVFYVRDDEKLTKYISYEACVENGISVLRVFYKKDMGKSVFSRVKNGFLFSIATILGYFRFIKENGRIDLIHVHVLTRCAVLPLLLHWLKNTPYVITEHWTRYLPEDDSYKGWLREKITRIAVRESRGVSCVSQTLEMSMKSKGLHHKYYKYISNVVDTDLFKPTHCPEKNKPVFLHVSGFNPDQKNVRGIIDAAFLLDKEGYSFDLYLIGGGKEKEVLVEYVKDLSFSSVNIVFTGELYQDQLVKYYSMADAFILFSYYENQPCVILESYACGLPVIGSNGGGTPELIKETMGVLVESGNLFSLKNAMLRVINADVCFNRKEIRENALNGFSYKAVRAQFHDFYTTALNN